MKIAVNTRLLIKNKLDGIGRFTQEVFRIITKKHPEHKFIFTFDRPFSEEFIFSDNIIPVYKGLPARHPVLIYSWYNFSLPLILDKYKADLFVGSDGFISLTTSVPSISVIHDLNFIHYPQFMPLSYRILYNYLFPKSAQKSIRIATVSEYSKNDIIKSYGVAASKIDVVGNASNAENINLNNEEIQTIRDEYSEGLKFFIYIGSINPRKNIANLFRAFDEFRERHDEKFKLLMLGRKMWWTSEIEQTYKEMRHREDVSFLGWVEDSKMYKILASSECLVYPSWFEGFGIPLVDAMYCNVPIITSDRTSLPEVAGDAALYCNPSEYKTITDAMIKIAKDKELREKLIKAGQERRKNFSWEQSATKMWNCIEKALEKC